MATAVGSGGGVALLPRARALRPRDSSAVATAAHQPHHELRGGERVNFSHFSAEHALESGRGDANDDGAAAAGTPLGSLRRACQPAGAAAVRLGDDATPEGCRRRRHADQEPSRSGGGGGGGGGASGGSSLLSDRRWVAQIHSREFRFTRRRRGALVARRSEAPGASSSPLTDDGDEAATSGVGVDHPDTPPLHRHDAHLSGPAAAENDVAEEKTKKQKNETGVDEGGWQLDASSKTLPPLLQMPTYKAALIVGSPVMVMGLLRSAFNLTDAYWAGKLGAAQLSAGLAPHFSPTLRYVVRQLMTAGMFRVTNLTPGSDSRYGPCKPSLNRHPGVTGTDVTSKIRTYAGIAYVM
jgi:hypothetical protein